MHDCLIIGGGIVGLSIAYEMARHGSRVCLLDRGVPGREASWAGAGMLPPGGTASDLKGDGQLSAISDRLHSDWARRLAEETGIDTGYRKSGAIHWARSPQAAAELQQDAAQWAREGIRVESIDAGRLEQLEPTLGNGRLRDTLSAAYHLPDQAQFRNPWHLRALVSACARYGVEIRQGTAAEGFRLESGRVEATLTSAGPIHAGQICLASGSWSGSLLERLGVRKSVRPIRGQIVLLAARPLLSRVVMEGSKYLVPRPDGRVLVGSTQEDVGFDCRATAGGAADLIAYALSAVPALADAAIEQSWAGLRPATQDGLPYLGRIPGLDNAFVATGHFRSGLQQACGTAHLMAQLMRGESPDMDLSPLAVDRG